MTVRLPWGAWYTPGKCPACGKVLERAYLDGLPVFVCPDHRPRTMKEQHGDRHRGEAPDPR
jgi:hypothetical protein